MEINNLKNISVSMSETNKFLESLDQLDALRAQ